MEQHYDVEGVFKKYANNEKLDVADIFHLYDTGEECIIDNSGFHDSRHFELVVFNTKTMEKRKLLGRHDGIEGILANAEVSKIRVYADGSFFISFKEPIGFDVFQCITLKNV
jgi:hypothetical protein